MGRRKRNGQEDEDNGFAQWGGYMAAKRAKLLEQFTSTNIEKLSDIFKGVAILVNGHTKPNSEELKALMAQHGGLYHSYQESATTHIIASNLPNVKITKLGNVPIVKPGWIVDSITLGRRLDYGNYLLYNNQSRTQPKLNFYLDIKKVKIDNKSEVDNKNDINLHDDDDLFIDKNDVNIDWSTKKIDNVKIDNSSGAKEDVKSRAMSIKNEVFSLKSPVRNINFDMFSVTDCNCVVKNVSPVKSVTNGNSSDCDIFDSDNDFNRQIMTTNFQNKKSSNKTTNGKSVSNDNFVVKIDSSLGKSNGFQSDFLHSGSHSSVKNGHKTINSVKNENNVKIDNINNNSFSLDGDIFGSSDFEFDSNDILKPNTDKIVNNDMCVSNTNDIFTTKCNETDKNVIKTDHLKCVESDSQCENFDCRIRNDNKNYRFDLKNNNNMAIESKNDNINFKIDNYDSGENGTSNVKNNTCVVICDNSVAKSDTSVAKSGPSVVKNETSIAKTDTSTSKSDTSNIEVDNCGTKLEPTIKISNISMNLETSLNKKPQTKTASDPKFLAEFYNNSRLHLIATLGAEFKQFVNDLREKSNNQFPALQNLRPQIPKPPPTTPIIMHIDMDCFFVSVGLRARPELKGQPVAVTHSKGGGARGGVDRRREIEMYMERLPDGAESRLEDIDNSCSLSEIASCSYEARSRGVKNGMFMGAALKLCPELKAIPYDFQGYREVSSILYETISKYTLNIEAVSCDEMYVDITEILTKTNLGVLDWAEHIRGVIRDKTGCPCSTGFGANRLQARLATKKAKPDGKYYLQPHEVQEYFSELNLGELPGVGRATLGKLRVLGFETCGDIQGSSLGFIQKELGFKIGENIWEQCQGIDKKPLSYEHERKSVSAEVNYGIRFKCEDEAIKFLESLANEVQSRLIETKMKAKCVTLKLMVRAQDAPTETAKFLGHGVCDSLSRSSSLPSATEDPTVIFKEAKSLYEKLKTPFEDLRGLGIQLSRLEKAAAMNNLMKSFLNKTKNQGYSKVEDTALASTSKTDSSNFDNTRASNVDIKTDSSTVDSCKLELPSSSSSASSIGNKEVLSEGCKGKVGGRGRPKGSKGGPKTSNNNLSNYFRTTQKDRKVETKANKTCNKPAIDLAVLSELPEDIRNEIIKEYNLGPTNKPKTGPKSKGTKPISAAINNKTTPETHIPKITSNPSNKNDFSSLDFSTLKTIISKWVHHEVCPLRVDTAMLADHFRQLALDRKIENLSVAIKFFHRHVYGKDCNWHEAYFTVLNSLQEGMIMRYGNGLLAPRKFDCDKHGFLNK